MESWQVPQPLVNNLWMTTHDVMFALVAFIKVFILLQAGKSEFLILSTLFREAHAVMCLAGLYLNDTYLGNCLTTVCYNLHFSLLGQKHT